MNLLTSAIVLSTFRTRVRLYAQRGQTQESIYIILMRTHQRMRQEYCNYFRCERTRRGERHLAHSLLDQDWKTLENLKELLGLGSILTGGIGAVSATGLLTADSIGAIIKGAADTVMGHVIKNLGEDYWHVFLAPMRRRESAGSLLLPWRRLRKTLRRERVYARM